jgi:hypothetical protein
MPLIYRTMAQARDGLPRVADTAVGLGVRDGDLDFNERRIAQPGTGGMSCAPSIEALPDPFRPPNHGGTGKYPVWALEEKALGERLTWRPDPDRPKKHLFVEPSRPMHMDEYREALWETRDEWQMCD